MQTSTTIEFLVAFNLIIKFVVSMAAGAPVGGGGSLEAFVDGHSVGAGLGGSVGSAVQGNLYATAGRVNPSDRSSIMNQSTSSASSSSSSSSSSSTSKSSSGSTQNVEGTFEHHRPHTNKFFDDIFNIPISTLGAVNQYLNNRKKVAVQTSNVEGSSLAFGAGSAGGSAGGSATGSSSGAASGGVPGDSTSIHYQGHHGKIGTNFNDIFNIPISVLNSVNRFLSG